MTKNDDNEAEKLAENRTNWAEDRTILANERTFSSWLGTALASAGVGLGFNAIFKASEPTWLAKLGASIFILIALFIVVVAYKSALNLHKRLNSHDADPVSYRHFGFITGVMFLGIFSLGAILWIL